MNIKILTGMAERAGALKREDRDALLASMTDEIASHVLAHNYDQTLALSLMQAEAPRPTWPPTPSSWPRSNTPGGSIAALEGLPDARRDRARWPRLATA